MEPTTTEPPAKRLQRYLEGLLKKFEKTPFVIPTAIGLTALVYYFLAVYSTYNCLIGIISPLMLLGICWYFNIKSIKKLLVIGLVASLVMGFVYAAAFTNQYQHLSYKVGASDDTDKTLRNGTLTPLYGDGNTVYEYRITVHVKNNTTTVSDVAVLIETVRFPNSYSENFTMTELDRNIDNKTGVGDIHYAYSTTLVGKVNMYVFWANVSGTWYIAADYTTNQALWLQGPMSKDSAAIYYLILPISLIQPFVSVFPTYGLILVMIWWLRKTRKMRIDQLERWEKDRAEEEKKKPKEDAKISLQRQAMGLEDEGSFVCSECGADVPADAKVCPKCGEKFE